MNKWISVNDYLPQYETRVLTLDKLKIQRVLVCDMFEDILDWYDEEWEGLEDSLEVTHWRRLPEFEEKIV